jgi:hypothetical protein
MGISPLTWNSGTWGESNTRMQIIPNADSDSGELNMSPRLRWGVLTIAAVVALTVTVVKMAIVVDGSVTLMTT